MAALRVGCRRTAWRTTMHALFVLLLTQRVCAFSWRDMAHMRTRGPTEERESDAALGAHNVMPRTNGEDDDIDTMTFEILQLSVSHVCDQYNVFGRPYEVSKDGQTERLARIPASLRKISEHIDVVTFAEADVKGERENMLAQFRDIGFQYATSILHDPDPFTRFDLLNGGVMVVSRWPILHEAQHIYRNACHYSDCLAAKGVKYARVLKTVGSTSKIFNVFATHMQPLLFAGDFNVDNHTFASEVAELIELLGAHSPTQVGDQQFTSEYVVDIFIQMPTQCPRSNLLVGRDGAANSNKCSEKYMQSWGDVKDTPYQQPLDGSTLESRISHVDPFVVDWTAPKSNMKMQLVDLSDHYPVLGKFVFAVNRGPGKDDDPLTYHLDGCSTDADCHFRAFRCYCNGANCYYNGTHLDGSDLASTHPVNRNCLYQKTSFQCLCGST
ncbi:Vacuolar protein sorting-associating protein, partial [Globisporangium splendens]